MTTRIITDSNGRKHITNEPQLHNPRRQWVGLTNNEIALIHADYPNPQGFARAIEAKLKAKNEWKEKNT